MLTDKDNRKWCPNCTNFLKIAGLNSCKLVDYRFVVISDPVVRKYLDDNAKKDTSILADAEDCPKFKPY